MGRDKDPEHNPVGFGRAKKTKATGAGHCVGGKRKPGNNRFEIVRKVMKDKGMSMIEASKYVKANGLY